MSNRDEYRLKAAEALDLAKKASKTGDKRRLLRLAEKWLDLADRAKHPPRLPPQHPRVKEVLGEGQELD